MALKIKVLANDLLNGTTAAKTVYTASPSPAKSAMVTAMRFANVSGVQATLNVYFVPSGSTYPTNARFIFPKGLVLQNGFVALDDNQLTLSPGDSIYAAASVSSASSARSISANFAGCRSKR